MRPDSFRQALSCANGFSYPTASWHFGATLNYCPSFLSKPFHLYIVFVTLYAIAQPTSGASFTAPHDSYANTIASDGGSNRTAPEKMDEIIVTAILPERLIEVPASISVITTDEIRYSGARNLPELLAQQANVVIKPLGDNAKFSSIDLRGSGDTSVSNVLTLIDGISINSADQSGADMSVVSLAQIERIEIIRGGNSVKYGSGASHGIINIITKIPEPGTANSFSAKTGSYGQNNLNNTFSMGGEHHSLALFMGYESSDGYRDNNEFNGRDLLLSYRAYLFSNLEIIFKNKLHKDDYVLPGSLGQSALASGMVERTDSLIGSTISGATEEDSQSLQLKYQPHRQLTISNNFRYRERDNNFIAGQSIDDALPSITDRIRLKSINGDITVTWTSSADLLSLVGSYHREESDYLSTRSGQFTQASELNNGNINTEAGFVHFNYSPTQSLSFSGGYRREHSSNDYRLDTIFEDESSPACDRSSQATGLPPPFDFITIVENCPLAVARGERERNHWDNEALEAGLLAHWNSSTTLYARYAKTFRNPNVDDLILFDGMPKSQTADRYESGLKYANYWLEADFNLFHFVSQNEITFSQNGLSGNANSGSNFNAAETIRRSGGELQLRIEPIDGLVFNANYGYTDARVMDNLRIPLVPFHTGFLGVSMQLADYFNVQLSTRYSGDRLDGNDFDNQSFKKLDAYTVANTSFNFTYPLKQGGELHCFVGINNLGNEQYADLGYNNQIYPATERNYYAGFTYALK